MRIGQNGCESDSPVSFPTSPLKVQENREPVTLSPSLVILSEAKNLRSSLRVNSARHLSSFSQGLEPKATAEILRFAQNDKRRAQDDSRLIFSHLLSLGERVARCPDALRREAGRAFARRRMTDAQGAQSSTPHRRVRGHSSASCYLPSTTLRNSRPPTSAARAPGTPCTRTSNAQRGWSAG